MAKRSKQVPTVDEVYDWIEPMPKLPDEFVHRFLEDVPRAIDVADKLRPANAWRADPADLPFNEVYEALGDAFGSGYYFEHLQKALADHDIPGIVRWAFWLGHADHQHLAEATDIASGRSRDCTNESMRRIRQYVKDGQKRQALADRRGKRAKALYASIVAETPEKTQKDIYEAIAVKLSEEFPDEKPIKGRTVKEYLKDIGSTNVQTAQ